jgi:hypothetical protein
MSDILSNRADSFFYCLVGVCNDVTGVTKIRAWASEIVELLRQSLFLSRCYSCPAVGSYFNRHMIHPFI